MKNPECFKPWCGIDGKKCVDCASYKPPAPFVRPAVEAVKAAIMPELMVTRGDGVPLPDQPQAVRDFIAQAARPLDTSTLGPVRLDPNSEAERARVVREALRAAAMEEEGEAHAALWQAAVLSSDGTMNKLRRLLKG